MAEGTRCSGCPARTPCEGHTLQYLHDRPDGVGLTEVVIEPQLVRPLVAVAFEEGDPAALLRATSALRPSNRNRVTAVLTWRSLDH